MVYAKHNSYPESWYTIYIKPTAAFTNFKLYAKFTLKQQTLHAKDWVDTWQVLQLHIEICTNLCSFVVHAIHGWKAYQVYFLTQQTEHLLDFPIKSYG